MLPFFGTMAIVIATVAAPAAPATPASPDAVRAAPAAAATTTSTTAAAAPSRRRARPQQAISVERPAVPTEEEVIRRQLELRVLMPPLSGDGGG